MPKINVDGVQVHYREQGSGPVVILLHSGASSGTQWRGVAENLPGRYRLIMPDLYGFGEAERWPEAPAKRTHDRDALLIRGLITHLFEPVHLVGHSLGGAVAMRLVLADRNNIQSLSLIEPGSAYSVLRHGGEIELYKKLQDITLQIIAKFEEGNEEGGWRDIVDGSNEPGTWEGISEQARQRLYGMTAATTSVHHSNLNDNTTLEDCASINIPTVVIMGEKTVPHYGCIGEIVAKNIPGSIFEVIPNAGHMCPVTHPTEVANLLDRHFKTVQAGGHHRE